MVLWFVSGALIEKMLLQTRFAIEDSVGSNYYRGANLSYYADSNSILIFVWSCFQAARSFTTAKSHGVMLQSDRHSFFYTNLFAFRYTTQWRCLLVIYLSAYNNTYILHLHILYIYFVCRSAVGYGWALERRSTGLAVRVQRPAMLQAVANRELHPRHLRREGLKEWCGLLLGLVFVIF